MTDDAKKLDLERLKALCEKMTAPGIDVDLIVSPMMAGLGPETVLQRKCADA